MSDLPGEIKSSHSNHNHNYNSNNNNNRPRDLSASLFASPLILISNDHQEKINIVLQSDLDIQENNANSQKYQHHLSSGDHGAVEMQNIIQPDAGSGSTSSRNIHL